MFGPPADAPKATCSTCGATYVDWEDYSGSAHPDRDCIAHLRAEIARLRSVADWARELRDEIRRTGSPSISTFAEFSASIDKLTEEHKSADRCVK